jgi:hypothetical protein
MPDDTPLEEAECQYCPADWAWAVNGNGEPMCRPCALRHSRGYMRPFDL